MPIPDIIVQSAIAGTLGFAAGSVVGRQAHRIVRTSLIVVALAVPIVGPSAVEFYRTSSNDPLGGVVWAFLAGLHFLVPIVVCVAAILFGHHQGCERRLDRRAREGGVIS